MKARKSRKKAIRVREKSSRKKGESGGGGGYYFCEGKLVASVFRIHGSRQKKKKKEEEKEKKKNQVVRIGEGN